jgi:hypothetical protein
MSTAIMTNKRKNIMPKKPYPSAALFIALLEKHTGLEPSEIYTKLGLSRQRYSLLKLGQAPFNTRLVKEFQPKAPKLGLSSSTYWTICHESLGSFLSSN